jgi:dTDP-4-dehydrorhamnose 3,5-epimerase
MIFTKTPLKDAYLIDLEKRGDERGFFARLFCVEEFAKHGLETCFIQANNSFSKEKGTFRGMHYQLAPKAETKLVRCIKGSLYDAILDLRPNSPTFGKSFGAVLSADNRLMMYVPRGFAHGFLTLEPDSEVFYLVSESYSKEHERGIRWNDPHFKIAWPASPVVLSERDRQHREFDFSYHLSDDVQINDARFPNLIER